MSELLKLLVIYGFSMILSCLWEVLIIHIAFLLLRQYSLGYHLPSNFRCIVGSILLFPVLCKISLIYELKITFTIFIIVILSILILGPVGTAKNKVFNESHLKFLKRKNFMRIVLIFIIYIFVPQKIQMLITLGVMIQLLMLIIQFTINKKEGLT